MNCQTFKLNLSFSCMGEQTNKQTNIFLLSPIILVYYRASIYINNLTNTNYGYYNGVSRV